jgi:NAD(P)-binding Rossmann-like domain
MNAPELHTDYLIKGAGAMGLAAADVLLAETDARLLIVDRHHRPGGHWNDAYPFVRLHQPSTTYGVNSKPLGRDLKDQVGLNQGMIELASGPEVLDYFDQLMNHHFLPSGRVQYLPMSEVLPDGTVRSLTSGRITPVRVARKRVDATFLNTQVPATRPPKYTVAPGMRCLPPNALPHIKEPPAGYVVVGAGKTAMDAVLWLLGQGVDPDSVRWIMPRDSWLMDRANVQPSTEFFMQRFGAVAAQLQCILDATSMADLYHRLEAAGQLLRIDPKVEPTMYHCAVVSQAELAQLRRIKHIVRAGRVLSIGKDQIELERGHIDTAAGVLHIDCSASALEPPPAVPVFSGNTISLQMVRSCQPVFSAAFIAHVEAAYSDEAQKNELCPLVPLPTPGLKWLEMLAANMANQHRWTRDEGLAQWLVKSRLDGFSALTRSVAEDDAPKRELLGRIRTLGGQARAKIPLLMASA